MKDRDNDAPSGSNGESHIVTQEHGVSGKEPALQVICLGSGGGPCEDNVTGLLVRAIGIGWEKASIVAVDAGSHLAPITRILEADFPLVSGAPVRNGSNGGSNGHGALPQNVLSPSPSSSPLAAVEQPPEPTTLTSGPFAGLTLPHASARANSIYLLRSYISTYLITHPHLDHISAFAINTAGFHATSRPKTLAALPGTVNAIKEHIFNDVIWPNLTDEDGGVGFVTFQRLKEGGDVMVGEGEGRGYIDVVDGVGVRGFQVSHGLCVKGAGSHRHRGSIVGLPPEPSQSGTNGETAPMMGRSGSASSHFHSQQLAQLQHQYGTGSKPSSPGPGAFTPRQQTYFASHSQQASPHFPPQGVPHRPSMDTSCVVDSTAYFLRCSEMPYRELLIWGDVEPDSLSLHPRNYIVWEEAARKVALGLLGGVMIECSFEDAVSDEVLFGHLCPRHLVAELQVLAGFVREEKEHRRLSEEHIKSKKRKRSAPNGTQSRGSGTEEQLGQAVAEAKKRSRSLADRYDHEARKPTRSERSIIQEVEMPNEDDDGFWRNGRAEDRAEPVDISPRSTSTAAHPPNASETDATHPAHYSSNAARGADSTHASAVGASQPSDELPLAGLKVVIIHVKDTLKDGPHVSHTILVQLQQHESTLRSEGKGLGCDFVIAESGGSYMF